MFCDFDPDRVPHTLWPSCFCVWHSEIVADPVKHEFHVVGARCLGISSRERGEYEIWLFF